jgi:murein DD-endopeptidase MepM/ murein hydrolase activator NlpD
MATDNSPDPAMGEDDPNPNKPPKTEPRKPAPPPRDEELSDDPDALKDEIKRMRDALTKANRLNVERRTKLDRLDELERAEEERKAAQLSEKERIEKETKAERQRREEAEHRAAEAEKKLIDQKIDTALYVEAAKRGWEWPETACQLVSKRAIEYDEDEDKVKGVKEAMDRLEKDKPGIGGSSPRGGTPPREGPRRTNPTGTREGRNPFEDELRSSGKYV